MNFRSTGSFSIQHIPHLGLAKLTVFVLLCVGVGGVYLHRQIFLGIDKFDEDRQSIASPTTWPSIASVRVFQVPRSFQVPAKRMTSISGSCSTTA